MQKIVFDQINPPSITRRHALFFTAAIAFFLGVVSSPAVTITSGPTVTPSPNAPLAALLHLTTDTPSRISVSADDGTESWKRNFYDYTTDHTMPLLGFKTNRTYSITVTVYDSLGSSNVAPQQLQFQTHSFPANFIPITVLKADPSKMEPGYTLFRALGGISGAAYVIIIDNTGSVVWYSGILSNFGIKRLANGNLFYPLQRTFEEVDMLGNVARTWPLPATLGYNHEATITERNTVLYLSDASRVVTNFPSSSTNPSAPRVVTNVWYNPVVEMSLLNGQVVNVWSPIDLLDPTRISYLTFTGRSAQYGWDWSHANSVIEDPSDDSIIVSIRHQNAVIKISRATGELVWILGTHDNWDPTFQQYLLDPVGEPFAWSYAQHAAVLTPRHTLLLFDNGNFRASPFAASVPDAMNYSRAVEYSIDEENMKVSQLWEYGGSETTNRIYSASRGSAKWMPETGNVLITYADVKYVNGQPPSVYSSAAAMERIIEVTHGLGDPPYPTPEVVLDVSLFDYSNHSRSYAGASGYRAERIPDLYPVTTAYGAVEQLITSITASQVDTNGTLVLPLFDTLNGLLSGDGEEPIEGLKTFQVQIQEELASAQPQVASQLGFLAQGIIDAINNGDLSWPGLVPPNIGRVSAIAQDGKLSLSFNGDISRIYLVQGCADMASWRTLGIAKSAGDGQFTFDSDLSDGQPQSFYRIVDPLGVIP